MTNDKPNLLIHKLLHIAQISACFFSRAKCKKCKKCFLLQFCIKQESIRIRKASNLSRYIARVETFQ